MNEKDAMLLEDTFKKFYFEHFDLLHVPENPEPVSYTHLTLPTKA